MEIGIGIDPTARLTFPQHREIIREAVRLGYASAWTPAGVGVDAFQVCGQWWQASTDVIPEGIATGISVVPVPIWSAPALATAAGTLGELTGGRFILGIGSGSIHSEGYRRSLGLGDVSPIRLMRDFLVALRGLLAGERVTHEGAAVTLRGVGLGRTPPPVPLYLGALGPQMLRLSGELADGAALNWCTPEQIAWSRERVADGARKAGRDPAAVRIAEYIRVCVDDDEDAARRAFTRAMMGYALARPGMSKEQGYRAHFARMGFDAALTDLEARRDRGAPEDELVDAFPRDLLTMVGYYGPAAGAAAAFRRLSQGLDTAIVRVVPVRPGPDAVAAVMRACRPGNVVGQSGSRAVGQ
jgi:alkanesulfonate monooxygenase SsuD/methylene tetrahydromethanopterin reductase-like flavin-dependent oxidoreductase (luciferase family)